MALFGSGPKGPKIGMSPAGIPIHAMVNIGSEMRRGGWCAMTGEPGSTPLLHDHAVDVTWGAARVSVLETISMTAIWASDTTSPWSVDDAAGLNELQQRVQQAGLDERFDVVVGPESDLTRFCLVPTAEAASLGARLETLCRQGKKTWIEVGQLPA